MGKKSAPKLGGSGKQQGKAADEPAAAKEAKPAAKKAVSQPSRLPPPRPRKGCCPDWFVWVVVPVFLFGIMPVVLLYLPEIIPPMPDAAQGEYTMVGGPSIKGIRGLYSVLNLFGTPFCAEQGARDTVKCHWSVLQLAYEMLFAAEFVDFYTVLPQHALDKATFDKYSTAACPIGNGKDWLDVAVDSNGAHASQVARFYLDHSGSPAKQAPPVYMQKPVRTFECENEFDAVFGKPRTQPQLLSEFAWPTQSKTTFYVFGLDNAISLIRAFPDTLGVSSPVNVIIFPAVDGVSAWYSRTRGRETCTAEHFREIYENSYAYVAWVLRRSNTDVVKLPGK
ncbi:hypothetical protein DIPPA_27911 [Diplonema papillatum]|nr:hypothetical protein DIPPA_27911 [Diplonema papillatum]KAJ9467810.1 hypothetical protein DIPPA_27911 [Diplonema papillatum]|eukprot:gene20396-31388_t